VNTRLLFLDLLGALGIQRVCDVGSMDGSESLAFRARLPRAAILAFEPHPDNFARMSADRRLAAANIEISPQAICDREGLAPFYRVALADEATAQARRGMSSLLPRDAAVYATDCVEVSTTRLDHVLAGPAAAGDRIALWIDVEGKAWEALEGMRRVAPQVHLLHVELESVPCISPAQRLASDTRRLLDELGYDELAIDQPSGHAQFNAVYLRRGQSAAVARRVARALAFARGRQRVVAALREHCPRLTRHLARQLARWRARFAA
jgi:FkbM family methyltransferase